MKTNPDKKSPPVLKASAEKFRLFQEAKERSAAAALLAEKARADAGIPGTVQLVSNLKLKRRNQKSEIVIIDENGAPLGKISVFWQDAYEVKAGFRSRIS